MKDRLKVIFESLKILDWGVLKEESNTRIVFMIPFKYDYEKGNIPPGYRGMDYHKIADIIYEKLKVELENLYANYEGQFFCDKCQENQKEIALKSRIGFRGINNLIIGQNTGSYGFICHIDSNIEVEDNIYGEAREAECMKCMKCVEVCPGGAISENAFEKEKCASFISQKKGELEAWEKEILKKAGNVYGCTICQEICPHNLDKGKIGLEEFEWNKMKNLEKDDLKDRTNKTFMNEYGDRGFAWRGKKTLERNIDILSEKK